MLKIYKRHENGIFMWHEAIKKRSTLKAIPKMK